MKRCSMPGSASAPGSTRVGPISGCEVRLQNPCTMWSKPGFCPVDGGSAQLTKNAQIVPDGAKGEHVYLGEAKALRRDLTAAQ